MQTKVELPAPEETPAAKITEAQRKQLFLEMFTLIRKEQPFMSAKYRELIKQNGSLLTESMVYAYTKAFNDIVKLLIKESKNEESV